MQVPWLSLPIGEISDREKIADPHGAQKIDVHSDAFHCQEAMLWTSRHLNDSCH